MKRIVVALLLISMLLMTLSSCNVTTGVAMKLVEAGKYEEAYKLASLLGDEELLAHFYWVPVDVTSKGMVGTHEYDENNLPIKYYVDETLYDTYKYDENGNIIENINVEGGYKTTITYEYDEQSRMTSVKYEVNGDYSYGKIFYNEEGLVVKEEYYDNFSGTEELDCVVDYLYNEKGQHYQDIHTYSDGTVKYSEYTYDERGNLIKKVSPAFDGTTQTETYTYDENNNLLVKYVEFTDGVHWAYEYTYDAEGRVTREFYHGGYSFESNEFATCMDYKYDEYGNVIKCIDLDGHNGSVEIIDITYRLVYVPFVYEDGINWTINQYTP